MGNLDTGIAQHLESEGLGDFSYGDNILTGTPPVIVVGESQPDPDAMITVLSVSGDPPDLAVGRTPKFQIISRDLSFETCRALAEAIHQALHGKQPGALDGEAVALIRADTEPIRLGRDPSGIGGGRHEFSQTFTVNTHDGA